MKKLMEDVTLFHNAVGAPVEERPVVPGVGRAELRAALIFEECMEFMEAVFPDFDYDTDDGQTHIFWGETTKVDHVEAADALADMVYVIVGTALEFGIPLDRVWEEVQRSNMDKVRDGVIRRSDGKILKPADWKGPDVEGCLK